MKKIKGIIAATITPMNQDETINYQALKNIIDWQIKAGVHGICVVNSVGEYYALSKKEMLTLYKKTVSFVKKRLPVYLGTAANTTKETIYLTQAAEESGADFVSVAPPTFVQLSEKELYHHFALLAKSVKIPIVLYNNLFTGNALTTKVVAQLSEDFSNIAGIKDGSGNLAQIIAYLHHCRPDFSVLCGRSELLFPAIIHGAAGGIASIANIAPRTLVKFYSSIVNKNYRRAIEIEKKLSPIIEAYHLGASFPANVKDCCNLLGIPAGPTRRPVSTMTRQQKKKALALLSHLKNENLF